MAQSAIKQEQLDLVEVENRILNLCQEIPKGINNAVIQNDMPRIQQAQIVKAINKLLAQNRIEILKVGEKLMYRARDPSSAKVKGADHQEKMVYQAIEKSGTKGIWNKFIRNETKLPLGQLNKVLKNMESKKLIKSVKSVAAAKRKVYMLYHLEPDKSVTGGAWYSGQDFDSEFVSMLNDQCFKYLEERAAVAKESNPDPMSQKNGSFVSSTDVTAYIAKLNVSKVPLTVEHIETILDTLIYDGKVESTIVAGGEDGTEQVKLYRAVQSLITTTGLMMTPCGSCPVFNDCHEGGEVSPENCVYMTRWLDF